MVLGAAYDFFLITCFFFFGCTYEKVRDCVAAERASISEML
jgi:hypothetical protein